VVGATSSEGFAVCACLRVDTARRDDARWRRVVAAFGCPTYESPAYSWVEHHPDHAMPGATITVRCNMTGESWSVTCLTNHSWTVPPPSTVYCPSTQAASFSTHRAVSGKTCRCICASNFAKCWPIFKIRSPAHLAVNLNSKAVIKCPTTRRRRRYTTLWNINVRKTATTSNMYCG